MEQVGHETATDPIDALILPISEAWETQDRIAMGRLVQGSHPSDVAEALERLDFDVLASVTRDLFLSDIAYCADMVMHFDPATIARLYTRLSIQEWSVLFKELSDDDVVYLIDLFPDEVQEMLVARIDKQSKEDVLELMTYPEESAGRMMTNEFIELDHQDTVEKAIEKIRAAKDFDPVNLMFIYVTQDEQLCGMVSLRQLLLHKRTTQVGTIMRTDYTAVDVNMDQEEVAELVRRHDDISVPVVNREGHVLGIITVDDIIDVIDEESEEDFYLQIGSSEEENLYPHNTRRIVMLRLPWILASFAGSLLVVFIMRLAEQGVFAENAAKIFTFVPMISAMGGNVGVQSSTIMARILSTDNLGWSETRRSTFREAKVGLSLGIICGVMIGVVAYFWGGWGMFTTVLTAMACTLTMAAITGTSIPVLMKQLGFDPALATGPFVTAFNDLIAICVYFSIVWMLRDSLGF
jgi:magnesium transporter